jgi:hypothetical protein
MNDRITFQRVAAMLITWPGRYKQLCREAGWNPGPQVRTNRFPTDQTITELSVAQWFAQSGVQFAQVDDAWTFATGWMEEQARCPEHEHAQGDWERLMQEPPLEDPGVGSMTEPWYPPADDLDPGAMPLLSEAGTDAVHDAGPVVVFTDYTPSSRPRDWASKVDAALVSGQDQVRVHVAGSGLHRPPPIPELPTAEYSGDVEMGTVDLSDPEETVLLGTQVSSPYNASLWEV